MGKLYLYNMMRQIALVSLILVFFISCRQKPETTTEPESQRQVTDTVEVGSWMKYYDSAGINGCFVLYSPAGKEVKVFNRERAFKRFTPASTFKIFNSLVALETGAVKDENEVIKWDGMKRRIENWNRDLDMKEAFKVSAVWFYQEVARRAGKERMQYWLDTVQYGNHTMGGANVDDFWLEEGLKITPFEQVAFLERLYKDSLPFSKRTMKVVKDVMLVKDVPYTMRAKTGWALRVNESVGWYVGWVEKGSDVYFFTNNMDMPHDSLAQSRIQITRDILREEGIID